ncbi:MAG: hypothetical protein ABJH96_03470 [Algoriphagus sp.]
MVKRFRSTLALIEVTKKLDLATRGWWWNFFFLEKGKKPIRFDINNAL